MKTIIVVTIITLLIISAVVLSKVAFQNQNLSSSQTIPTPSPTSAPQEKVVDIKATFGIITNGMVRSFKNPKYHQRSSEVYLLADDPTVVHVKKAGTTWDDFFKTLPMKLTHDCLTTGDGETYCTGSDGTLRFYLNDNEDPNLLDREIKDGDKALIEF